jgi:HEAT repeat protein
MRSRATPLLVVLAFASGAFAQQGGDDEPLRALLAALDDPSATTRRDACRALGKRTPFAPEAVDALIERVKTDEVAVVRASAAWALGRAGDRGKHTLPLLRERLHAEQDRLVVRAIFWAIVQFDPTARWRLLTPDPSILLPIDVWAMASIVTLTNGARGSDKRLRWSAIDRLARLGAPALDALRGLLRHEDPAVRAHVAWSLGRLPHRADPGPSSCGMTEDLRDFVPPSFEALDAAALDLTRLLRDPVDHVREAAADGLGNLREHARVAVPALVDILRDPSVEVRRAASRAIGMIAWCEPALDALLERIEHDSDAGVRALATWAFSLSKQAQVIPTLWHIAGEDASPHVRLEALGALVEKGGPRERCVEAIAEHVLTSDDGEARLSACEVLIGLEPEGLNRAIPALISLFESANDQLQATAHEMLVDHLDDARVVEAFVRRIDAGDVHAMHALAEARTPAALRTLARWLDHDDPSDRAYAVRTLTDSSGEAAAPFLVDAFARDLPDDELADLAYTLWSLGPAAADATPRLLELATDTAAEVGVRQAAVRALGAVGTSDARVVPALEQLLGDADPELRDLALVAVGELGPLAAACSPTLLRTLSASDEHEVATSADVLGRVLAPDAVPALAGLLSHPAHDLREVAARALARFGEASRPALDALVVALDDDSSEVRRDAALALAAIGPAAAAAWPGLCRALDDEDPGVRPAARAALAAIAGDAQSAVPRLVVDLDDRDARVRESAALALGQLGARAATAVPALLRRLEAHDVAAAEALGRIGAPELAVPALERALEESEHDAFIRAGRRALRDLR